MRLRALLIIMSLAISLIPIGIIAGFHGIEIATVSLGIILVVILIVSFMMSYLITMPLQKLTKNIDVISKGNLDVGLEKSEIYEINNLINSLKRVMVSLKLAIYKVGIVKEDIFEDTMKEKNTAESRYSSLLKVVDGWVWEIDNNGVWQFCSEKISETLGYQPSEIVGKNISDFLDTKDKPKLKKMFKNHTSKSTENQDFSTTIELNFHHKAGNNVPFLSSIIPFYDKSSDLLGFRGMSKKIVGNYQEKTDFNEKITASTDEKVKMLNEKESTRRLSNKNLLVNSADKNEFDYRFLFDKDTHIVECTTDIAKKLGYDKSEFLSLNLNDLNYLERKETIKNKIDKIKDLEKMDFKTMYQKKDKKIILVNETIRYLKDRDLFECYVKEEIFSK
jgi:PAS domain S-box-containing protein